MQPARFLNGDDNETKKRDPRLLEEEKSCSATWRSRSAEGAAARTQSPGTERQAARDLDEIRPPRIVGIERRTSQWFEESAVRLSGESIPAESVRKPEKSRFGHVSTAIVFKPARLPRGIESGRVARHLDLADAIDFHIPKSRREHAHQLLVTRANALSLAVVWIAGRSVTRKETLQRSKLHRGIRGRAYQPRKSISTRRRALPFVLNGEELERAVGFARINEAPARPLQFFAQLRVGFSRRRVLFVTGLRD